MEFGRREDIRMEKQVVDQLLRAAGRDEPRVRDYLEAVRLLPRDALELPCREAGEA